MGKRVEWFSGLVLLSMALPAMSQNAAPGGSYRQSCRNITAGQNVVNALCKTQVWGEVNAFLELKRCNPRFFTGLTNKNGDLICEGPLPAGSYLRSCRDGFVMDNNLNAVCEDKGGHWHSTSVPLAGCNIGFTNSDGRLLCGR